MAQQSNVYMGAEEDSSWTHVQLSDNFIEYFQQEASNVAQGSQQLPLSVKEHKACGSVHPCEAQLWLNGSYEDYIFVVDF